MRGTQGRAAPCLCPHPAGVQTAQHPRAPVSLFPAQRREAPQGWARPARCPPPPCLALSLSPPLGLPLPAPHTRHQLVRPLPSFKVISLSRTSFPSPGATISQTPSRGCWQLEEGLHVEGAASFPTASESPCSSKGDDAAERPCPACLTAQPPQLRPASRLQTSLFIPPGHGHTYGWDTRVHTLQHTHTEHATPALSSPLHLAPFLQPLLRPRPWSKQCLAFWHRGSQPHCPEPSSLVCV